MKGNARSPADTTDLLGVPSIRPSGADGARGGAAGLLLAMRERPPIRSYVLALVAVGIALVLTRALSLYIEGTVTVIFLAAVIVAAWKGGLWPGVFATVLSMIALSRYVLNEPVVAPAGRWGDFFILSIFAGVAVGFSALNALRKQAQDELRRERADLEVRINRRTDQLRQEIAERRRAEQTLKESEERYRALFENAPVAYHEIDRDGVVRRVNAAECELLGLPPEQILNRPVWELVAPEFREISRQMVGEKLAGTRPLSLFTREFLRPGGERVYVEIRERLICDAAGHVLGIQSSLHDITEQRKADAEIRRLNLELESKVEERTAELQRSNDALQQFAYSASHDLQEPLRIVSSYAQLLCRRYQEKLDHEAQEYLDYITDGTSRMMQLIRDLLAYSRAGQMSDRPVETVDMRQVVERALRNLQAAFEESGAVLTADDLPSVKGREVGLAQVLQNLIGNAIKYRNSAPPAIHISVEEMPHEWVFCVRDNGIGFDPRHAERIFGIFKRLHGREVPGTGIGLAVCRRVIEGNGGRIWGESQPGAGSRFYFTLPKA